MDTTRAGIVAISDKTQFRVREGAQNPAGTYTKQQKVQFNGFAQTPLVTASLSGWGVNKGVDVTPQLFNIQITVSDVSPTAATLTLTTVYDKSLSAQDAASFTVTWLAIGVAS